MMNEVYKAISDRNRRKILRMLREGDMHAGDIADQFDISWPSISHHLKVLRLANLVLVERQGQELLYSLNTTVLQDLATEIIDLVGEGSDE